MYLQNYCNEFKEFFSQENNLVFCNDIWCVIQALVNQHDPNEWHLCTDSSNISLKAVLLHNWNTLPFVPLVHAANMKETYENMKLLVKNIQYEKYNWNICGDLKVTALLLGLQLGDSSGRKYKNIQKQ